MEHSADIDLLRQYAESGSEVAFGELVRRYVNLVHSVAWRHTGNPHHAEEITQAVFIILARKAGRLGPRIILSGWLYQTARLTAANFMRGEMRRVNREKEAHMSLSSNEPPMLEWRAIAPLLDDAMGTLREKDRNVIVLRFFENKTLAEVGQAFGISEDSAKMRVYRALDKLRAFFKRKGVTVSAALLAEVLAAHSVQASPAALTASTIAAAHGATAKVSAIALAKATLQIMSATKLKLTIAAALLALLVLNGGVVWYFFVHAVHKTLTFADVRESDIPGRYKFTDGPASFFMVLYADHTFMNRDGTTFPQYWWDVGPNGFVINWQRNRSVFTNVVAPGSYSSVKRNGGIATFEKLPPYRAADLVLPPPVASISFGAQCQTNGLHPVNTDADGTIYASILNGEQSYQMVRQPGRPQACLYLQVAPELKNPPFSNAMVLVEYFDASTGGGPSGQLTIQYDATIGEYANVQPLPLTGSDSWQQTTFYLAGPQFENRQSGGADFRVSTSRRDLAIRSVKLLKNVPIPETKMPSTRVLTSR